MPAQLNIRFYDELNDFLPQDLHKKAFDVELKKARSIKDLIESIGIPHTEVGLIMVNSESVDFSYQVKPDDNISVYPFFRSIDISPVRYCQPAALLHTRFVLDVHLGRLAAYLRMLGFDTLYRNDYGDPVLADISAEEQRILLTCDRLLLMRKQVSYGYFVRSRQPKEQLFETLSRFDLYDCVKPFSRCMLCNGLTQPVAKQMIETQLLSKTRKYYDEFFQCDTCKKIYWKGSHFRKMEDLINQVKVISRLQNT